MAKRSTKRIVGQRFANYRDVIEDRHFITAAIGPLLEPVLLSLRQTPDYRWENATGCSFPKQRAAKANDFRVHYLTGQEWHFVDLAPTNENYHSVQPLGSDEWLLIRGRSKSESDENAHVYGFDGKLRRSFHAGDGIQDAQTTRDERVWISYFDEGVLSPVRTGKSGLICLDKNGLKLHDFGRIAETTGLITDCYALNVVNNDDTWVYYYTDFPLVKLTSGRLAKCWRRIPVSGSSAFAITDKKMVLAGSYDDRASLFEVDLSTMKKRRLEPIDDSGAPIRRFTALGRSHCLFLSTDESLFRIDALGRRMK